MKARWRDLRLSILDVLSPLEDWKSGLLKVVGLLTILGVPIVSVQSEDLRPATAAGTILWSFAIAVALALGIWAVYRRRREVSPARAQRNEARRSLFNAMNSILILLDRGSSGSSSALKILRDELEPAVREYEAATKLLHPSEGLVHQKQCGVLLSLCQLKGNLLAAALAQLLVRGTMQQFAEFYLAQVSLLEALDEDESEALRKMIRFSTSSSTSRPEAPPPPGSITPDRTATAASLTADGPK